MSLHHPLTLLYLLFLNSFQLLNQLQKMSLTHGKNVITQTLNKGRLLVLTIYLSFYHVDVCAFIYPSSCLFLDFFSSVFSSFFFQLNAQRLNQVTASNNHQFGSLLRFHFLHLINRLCQSQFDERMLQKWKQYLFF